jgi:hypothetical protein
MSKLVNWGRWPVALLFALQGVSILFGALGVAINTLRQGSGTFYPTYEQLLESLALLLCSWGLLKMRGWAYWLAIGISLFEFLVFAALVASVGVKTSGAWLSMGGLKVHTGSNLIPCGIVFICLAWLLLPSVRKQYLQEGLPA